MPSQKGKRAKGVQMTEQQPKTPQIIDIVGGVLLPHFTREGY
jgi:hypothetical protein